MYHFLAAKLGKNFLMEMKMKKLTMFILIVFSIASLLVFTGCKGANDTTEPADETMTEETTPSEDMTTPMESEEPETMPETEAE